MSDYSNTIFFMNLDLVVSYTKAWNNSSCENQPSQKYKDFVYLGVPGGQVVWSATFLLSFLVICWERLCPNLNKYTQIHLDPRVRGSNPTQDSFSRQIFENKFDTKDKKIICQFCQIGKDCFRNVDRLFQNDEKLPCLH